ncbi:Vacuolar-sorting receptor 1 [Paramecium bursaria]
MPSNNPIRTIIRIILYIQKYDEKIQRQLQNKFTQYYSENLIVYQNKQNNNYLNFNIMFIVLLLQSFNCQISIIQPKSFANNYKSVDQIVPFSNYQNQSGFLEISESINNCKLNQSEDLSYKIILSNSSCDPNVQVEIAAKLNASIIILTKLFKQLNNHPTIVTIIARDEEYAAVTDYLYNQRKLSSIEQGPAIFVKFQVENVQIKTRFGSGISLDVALIVDNIESYSKLFQIKQYLNIFQSTQIDINVIYHMLSAYDTNNNSLITKNCYGQGKYCYSSERYGMKQPGQEVLNEIIRQSCLRALNQTSWWTYMYQFGLKCADNFQLQKCSYEIMMEYQLEQDVVDKCFQQSFNTSQSYESENYILRQYAEYQYNQTYSTYLYNNTYFSEEDSLISNICYDKSHAPSFCKIKQWQSQSYIYYQRLLMDYLYYLMGIGFFTLLISLQIRNQNQKKTLIQTVQKETLYESQQLVKSDDFEL